MCGFEIENNDVGQMLAMFVLTAEYEKFIALPETRGMP